MRVLKIFIILFIFYSSSFSKNNDEEITLYNKEGAAIAYISIEEDYTIYLWDGEPVAYLKNVSKEISIYNFDGEHLGWYDNGLIIDHNAEIVGFREGALSILTQFEPFKSFKSFKPFKSIEEIAPTKPATNDYWSKIPFELFLLESISDPSQIVIDAIDGEFEGFEGETIMILMNGQIWQQYDYHYEYTYEYMPKVIIYKKKGGYKIKVEGIDEPVGVIRLK